MKRLTFRDMELTLQWLANCGEGAHLDPDEVSEMVEQLHSEIRKLGGPVCRVCEENQARYSSGCCAICDMQLPKEERGVRL